MANSIFNVAHGTIVEKVNNAVTMKALLLKTAQSQATLVGYATIAALLAASSGTVNVECSGYTRPTLASLSKSGTTTVTVDSADINFGVVSMQSGTAPTVCVVVYQDGGSDAANIPLTVHDFVTIPDGSTLIATVSGFYQVS